MPSKFSSRRPRLSAEGGAVKRDRVASSLRGPTPITDKSAKELAAAVNRLAAVLESLSGPFGMKMHHTGIPAPFNQPFYQPLQRPFPPSWHQPTD